MRHPLLNRFPDRENAFKVFFHPDCLLHEGPAAHPEQPERLKAILEGCLLLPKRTPVSFAIPQPAGFDQVLALHDQQYLNRLEEAQHKTTVFMSPDNYLCQDSFAAIQASAGCALASGESLLEGVSSFALTRPAGHHAMRSTAEGFCFINNVALATEIVRCSRPGAKCLIVDFDAHYGNGIDYFYNRDPQVLYYSIHADPDQIYPHCGFPDETGRDKGRGTKCNVVVNTGVAGTQWLKTFQKTLLEFVTKNTPEFLLVSAGFDAHKEDPLGLMSLTDRHFLNAINLLLEIADEHCDGISAWFLEGGYSIPVLKRMVPKVIKKLAR